MPTDKEIKHRIAQSFTSAATSYAHAALAQERVAKALLAHIRLSAADRILDLGCGSGTEFKNLRLRYPNSSLIGLDFSEAMLRQALELNLTKNHHHEATSDRPRIDVCLADFEQLPFKEQSFDLIYSSLAMQWCSDIPDVLTQLHRVIKDGGQLAFSTLVEGNFPELSTAWQSIDSYQHSNEYASVAQHRVLIDDSPFRVDKFEQSTVTLYFDSLKQLFQNLRQTGVTTVLNNPRKGLLTPSQYKALEQQYETFRTDQGLPASYQVLYCVLTRQTGS